MYSLSAKPNAITALAGTNSLGFRARGKQRINESKARKSENKRQLARHFIVYITQSTEQINRGGCAIKSKRDVKSATALFLLTGFR